MTYYKFLRLKNGRVISDWDESAWERSEWRDIAVAPVLQAQVGGAEAVCSRVSV